MIVLIYYDNLVVKILEVFIRVSIAPKLETDTNPFFSAINLCCHGPPSIQFEMKNFKLIGGKYNGKNA